MEISEIKQQLTMAMVLHYYGLKPTKQSRLHCPFYQDKTPSMQVYYKTPIARQSVRINYRKKKNPLIKD